MFRSKNTDKIKNTDALGYKRVSDIIQKDGASLDTQDKAITKYCEDNKLKLINIYSDIMSGLSTNNREGFLQLMKDVKNGNFIIVFELSRFARDQQDTINYFRDLVRNRGCTFICLNPPLDSRDSCCDLMVGIYSTLNENESKRISERVTANMQRLSDEDSLITRPPFGYVHDSNTRKFIPDPEQQEVINKLQLWYLANVSINEMTKRLNNEGFGHVLNNNKVKKFSNPKFNPVTVGMILRNYRFLIDYKTPDCAIPQRIENWNKMPHKSKSHR